MVIRRTQTSKGRHVPTSPYDTMNHVSFLHRIYSVYTQYIYTYMRCCYITATKISFHSRGRCLSQCMFTANPFAATILTLTGCFVILSVGPKFAQHKLCAVFFYQVRGGDTFTHPLATYCGRSTWKGLHEHIHNQLNWGRGYHDCSVQFEMNVAWLVLHYSSTMISVCSI